MGKYHLHVRNIVKFAVFLSILDEKLFLVAIHSGIALSMNDILKANLEFYHNYLSWYNFVEHS